MSDVSNEENYSFASQSLTSQQFNDLEYECIEKTFSVEYNSHNSIFRSMSMDKDESCNIISSDAPIMTSTNYGECAFFQDHVPLENLGYSYGASDDLSAYSFFPHEE